MNPIIKKQHVRVDTDAPVPRRRRGHAKVARLLRVEGEVRGIEYQCSCGEVTVLEIEYEPGASAGGTDAPATPSTPTVTTQEAA
jgi:hypothetical protein